MTILRSLTLPLFLLIASAVAPAGAQENGQGQEEVISKSSTCAAFDTSRDATDYSARLVGQDDGGFEIQIQAVHAKEMASPIKKITLSNGSTPKFKMLEDNCICGMRINDVEVECTHITKLHGANLAGDAGKGDRYRPGDDLPSGKRAYRGRTAFWRRRNQKNALTTLALRAT